MALQLEEANTVDIKTRLSDEGPKDEIDTKHPLQNEWDFWYLKPNKSSKNWMDNLLKIHSFNTVEDFWALYNHIELPSGICLNSDYNLFKSGIKPMWEDPRNRNGGRLVILLKKSNKDGKEFRTFEDQMWLEICLCLIGEIFGEENDKICGLVFNARQKHDKISIWTSDYKDEAGIMKIGNLIKSKVRIFERLVYEKHSDDRNKAQLFMI